MQISKAIRTLTRRRERLAHDIELASGPEAARRRTWMAGEASALDTALVALEEMRLRVHEYRSARCKDAG